MARLLAAAVAGMLVLVGAFFIWQGRAEEPPLPSAPQPRLASATQMPMSPTPAAPEADAKSKEEKRFDRADKNDDGRISLAELVEPRRKAFSKLDANSDGRLSFEEWAIATIDKFEGADADQNKWLAPAEYATTAPKPKKKPACACS